jgi:hypothetical protein
VGTIPDSKGYGDWAFFAEASAVGGLTDRCGGFQIQNSRFKISDSKFKKGMGIGPSFAEASAGEGFGDWGIGGLGD